MWELFQKFGIRFNQITHAQFIWHYWSPTTYICNIIWALPFKTMALDKIFKIQKKYCRLITFSLYKAHSNPLFSKLKFLTVYDINKLQIALHMYKIINRLISYNEHFDFRTNFQIHDHDTRQKNDIHQAYCRTQTRQNTLQFQGPKLWNALPTELKNVTPISHFKRKLKLHLFDFDLPFYKS